MEDPKKRVLIVEDDKLLALVEDRLVTKLGYEVVGKASSGQEAIRMTSELNPDILLMDISLNGELDGIETVEQIRKNSSVAVIYLSGNSDKFNYERAKKTGFISYLVKPVTQEELSEPLLKASSLDKEPRFTPALEFNREKNTRRRLVNQIG